MALAFSHGKPFRKPVYTNLLLISSMLILLGLGLLFLFIRVSFIDDLMGVRIHIHIKISLFLWHPKGMKYLDRGCNY